MSEPCPTCGGVRRDDPDEHAAAEIALAHIKALLKRPAGLAQAEQVLRHLQGARGGVARLIEFEEERAARGR